MHVEPEENTWAIKRLPVELNLKAARQRQSSQTGFVHHCYDSEAEQHETIPLFENFCFALALLRSKKSENMLEGLSLLHKLLAFEKEGHFPVYLHEFPQCRDPMLIVRLSPLFTFIIAEFRSILDRALSHRLHQLIDSSFCEKDGRVPQSPEQWAAALIEHASGRSKAPSSFLEEALRRWHPELLTYIGTQEQEKKEPKPTLFDFFMSDYYQAYPARLLKDHPIHLRTSLVYPLEAIASLARISTFSGSLPTLHDESAREIPFQTIVPEHPKEPYVLYWGGAAHLHSLACAPKKAQCLIKKLEKGADFTLTLDPSLDPPQEDLMEVAFFCDHHPAHRLLPSGKKANTFQLQEDLEIHSNHLLIRMTFSLLEGEGTFFGHLFRANRPLQMAAKGILRHEAYDWQIGLRTIRRTERCIVRVHLRWEQGITSSS